VFWGVVAVADEDLGRACFIVGHGFPSPGVDDLGSSMLEVYLLLTVAVPILCVLPRLEEVVVEAIVA
jgi:hypothetical protein